MADVGELQAKLKLLGDAYAAQLPERLKQLEQIWQQLPKGAWDEAGFETLHRMVHSLTGSGKTFGFASLSDAARNLEDYLNQIAEAKTVLSAAQRQHIQISMRELHECVQRRDDSDMAGLIKVVQPGQEFDAR